jgi:hypothetical protein
MASRGQLVTDNLQRRRLDCFQRFCCSRHRLVDVERIIMRQGSKLRVDQILSELRPLVQAKDGRQILGQLRAIFDQYLAD